jgi:hypothetical protein
VSSSLARVGAMGATGTFVLFIICADSSLIHAGIRRRRSSISDRRLFDSAFPTARTGRPLSAKAKHASLV